MYLGTLEHALSISILRSLWDAFACLLGISATEQLASDLTRWDLVACKRNIKLPSGTAESKLTKLMTIWTSSAQSYKHFMSVHYDSSQYNSRVVNYDRKVLYKIDHRNDISVNIGSQSWPKR